MVVARREIFEFKFGAKFLETRRRKRSSDSLDVVSYRRQQNLSNFYRRRKRRRRVEVGKFRRADRHVVDLRNGGSLFGIESFRRRYRGFRDFGLKGKSDQLESFADSFEVNCNLKIAFDSLI